MNSELGCALLLLLLTAQLVAVDSVHYPTKRVMRDDTAALKCWQVDSAAELTVWITPDNNIIGSGDSSVDWNKFEISANASLLIKVLALPTIKSKR